MFTTILTNIAAPLPSGGVGGGLLAYILWNPSIEAFRIGPMAFRWYSLCWLAGLLLAYLVVKRLFKEQHIPDEKFDPLFIYCFLGILIGARLGHCIFYQPDYFLTSWKGFIEMLLPIHIDPQGSWHMTGYQGLASHGGTLGLILALLLYVKRIKVPLWQVLDNIAIATGTTACFIRLGNLMNSEIIGRIITHVPADAPWYSFWFQQVDPLPVFRHPGQLYEALAYALLFVIMWTIYKKNANSQQPTANSLQVGTGFYFGLCLTYIFLFRFGIEYTKEVQEAFEENLMFDMGQLLSVPFVLIGVWCMVRALRKHRNMLCLLLLGCLAPMQLSAAEADYNDDPVHRQLYHRFLTLYANCQQPDTFYAAADALANYYKTNGLVKQYYKMQLNICLYDSEHDRPSRAMKRAQDMLTAMEEEGVDAYSQVYTALGTIFESRGNYGISKYYYQKSIDNLPPDDEATKISIYSRMAYLLMFSDPVEAKRWNEKYYQESFDFAAYHQVYLVINAMIDLALNDRYDFEKTYLRYNNYHNEHPDLDSYGKGLMALTRQVFQENYEEALRLLADDKSMDLDRLGVYDVRTIIYQRMNRLDLALANTQQKIACIDSLNSDMLFNNINELNTAAGLGQAQGKANKMKDTLFRVVSVLLLAIIALLAVWIFHFRKSREQLKQKNEQLRMALAMAEEGEKMKTEFVRSVSHEIRTPLNAINGFNDILNMPGIELPEEERADLLNRIKENVKAITEIVDEMLHMADKESNEYPKSDKIFCNQFFSTLLYEHRNRVVPSVNLTYTTKLINRFQLQTNVEGVRKIMEQVIQNAIKFTKQGHIRVHCQLSDDQKALLVSIEDTGCGIPEEKQEKIFEGFYKADSFEQGIGLGLAVSKKIARKLGGDLVLDTSYTGGARFVLSLPME